MSNVLIILTSTVNVQLNKIWIHQRDASERASVYLKSVKRWLDETNLKICLVENSGYTFPELDEYKTKYNDRFEIINVDESAVEAPKIKYLIDSNSKGASEMYSVYYAYNNSKFKSSVNFIIKITARYFVPGFEDMLLKNDFGTRTKHIGIKDCDNAIICLRQHSEHRCEIVGVHKRFFNIIFELNVIDDDNLFYSHSESIYYSRFKLLNPEKMFVCPPFDIEPTMMGGSGHISTAL